MERVYISHYFLALNGAVAQLGERLNGIQEVVSSILIGSTIKQYFVYIIYSESLDRYYTGHTQDALHRLTKHNAGYEKSTKSGIPWVLKHTESFISRSEAMQRENEIKRKKSRKYIEWIIAEGK